jgi:hypothetical protein
MLNEFLTHFYDLPYEKQLRSTITTAYEIGNISTVLRLSTEYNKFFCFTCLFASSPFSRCSVKYRGLVKRPMQMGIFALIK